MLHFTNIYYGNIYANSKTENKISETMLDAQAMAVYTSHHIYLGFTFDQIEKGKKEEKKEKETDEKQNTSSIWIV